MCLLPSSICFWVEEWWHNGPGVMDLPHMVVWWKSGIPENNWLISKRVTYFFKHPDPKIMAGKMLILGWFLRPTWQCACKCHCPLSSCLKIEVNPFKFHGLNFKKGKQDFTRDISSHDWYQYKGGLDSTPLVYLWKEVVWPDQLHCFFFFARYKRWLFPYNMLWSHFPLLETSWEYGAKYNPLRNRYPK